MIKFACPACAAVFSVGDEKAGKTGKCPKCESPFVIPEAEASSAPAPATDSADVEIKPCPGCKATLTVAKSDLGLDVECPYCKTVYKATKLGGTATAPSADDRPSRRPRAEDADGEDDGPRRRSRRDDDDDDYDDRPRRRRRSGPSSSAESSALGTVALITGIMSIFPGCCCLFLSLPLGITAIITGILGLKTKAKGMAIAGIILGALGLILVVGLFVLQMTGKLDQFNAGNPNGNPFRKVR